jgi:F-type H+-transporting ATPase subunit epsilon
VSGLPAFRVRILTPQRTVFDQEAEYLSVPAGLGYAGILANHAPYMTTVTRGLISIRDRAGKTTQFEAGSSGFMEVLRNNATVLLESVQPITES